MRLFYGQAAPNIFGMHHEARDESLARIQRYARAELTEPSASGSLRLGVSEDFVPDQLPRRLARFGRLSGRLPRLDNRVERRSFRGIRRRSASCRDMQEGRSRLQGRIAWREPLFRTASPDFKLDFSRPARLAMLKAPCSYRDIMVSTLDNVRREWVAICTPSSLMGIQAAVAVGLGVTA